MEPADPLDHLVARPTAPQARGAFALRVSMSGAWSIVVDDGAALSILVLLDGSAAVRRGSEVVTAAPGDVVLLPQGEQYAVAHDAARARDLAGPPTARILPGQECVSADGADLSLEFHRGVRTWGNALASDGADGASATMLLGTYEATGAAGRLALGSLPALAHVPDPRSARAAVALLENELSREGVGQQTVIDRLLDVLVVTTVRDVLDRWPSGPGPLATTADPLVERAVRLLHADPARAWTTGALARGVDVSRSTLAARFSRCVGVPPMTYLSQWRLDLARDLLDDTGSTIAAIADSVGYGSAFSLSMAFRRRHGVSPSDYRRRGAIRTPTPS